jgi:hypothetical protein
MLRSGSTVVCAVRGLPSPSNVVTSATVSPRAAVRADVLPDRLCSTDELRGLKPVRETLALKTARLVKRLHRVEDLPPADQRAVGQARRRDARNPPPLHPTIAPRRNARRADGYLVRSG